MARPLGVRNPDFEEKRSALLSKLMAYLLRDDVRKPSFRQLAIASEASEPTLRHYFKNRSGLIVAVIDHIHDENEPFLDELRQPSETSKEAVEGYLKFLHNFRKDSRYAQVHAFGIRESLSDESAQKAYLTRLVSPAIEVLAERLVRSEGGPTSLPEARSAATLLMSASIFMILHQDVLNGREHVPIDHDNYLEKVGSWFVTGIDNFE